MHELFDVVVVGGGHVGLTASYFLKGAGISHVVLEKSQIANTWRTQRWDSFNLVLPNWTLGLPNFSYQGSNPDGYLNLKETIEYVENFSEKFHLPVRTGAEVLQVTGTERNFEILTSAGKIHAKYVIIATGGFHSPKIPDFSKKLSPDIMQLHSSQYRNPSNLPQGSTLIVGTGQSGAQIAEELHTSGRKVFLSVSRCGGRPRKYRGKDCVWWMNERGFYDQTASSLTSPQKRLACNVPLTGHDGGRDIDLYDFSKKGIHLLGRLVGGESENLEIAQDLESNLQFADVEWNRFLADCDAFAVDRHLQLPTEPAAYRPENRLPPQAVATLNLNKENITSIVWATGFELSYQWIKIPVFDPSGYPKQNNGSSDCLGLFFLGLPWLTKRKSSIFLGTTEDAQVVTSQILKDLQNK